MSRRLLISTITLLATCQLLCCSTIISVIRDQGGQWQVVSGQVEGWVVLANLTDRRAEDGWLHLDLTSDQTESDEEQAEAAGLAEGFLCHGLISDYYQHFIQAGLCQVDSAFCDFVRQQFQTNLDWLRISI